ncbi:MAG TPA: Fur family transcriptional regulator [Roseiarcus sp.]|nr:Fur family transcriptional regulator [Roseiarcus sp.]
MSLKNSHGRWAEQVEEACLSKGLQLTPLRRRVLSILSDSGEPLGAYAIIDRLSKLEGKQVAPPTVYRTLEFFEDNGFLHKIESRNVFVPCEHPGHAHAGVLLLCDVCGQAQEREDDDLAGAVGRAAERAGFTIVPQMLELHGLCQSCASAGRGAA